MEKKKMNFIIYYPDSMRAESVSVYGNHAIQTPNFERMANNGVTFEKAFVQNPVCTPSRISMMTGRYVHNDGHRTLYHSIRNHEESLLTYLKNDGYEIGWFGKNDLYASERVKELIGTKSHKNFLSKDNPRFSQNESGYYSFLENASYKGLPEKSESEVDQAIRFIKQMNEEGKAFCVFIPIGIPHVPFYAPDCYHTMYDNVEIASLKPIPEEPKPMYYDLITEYRNLHTLKKEQFHEMQKIYTGMVSFADMLLGKILDTVDELDLSDTTTVFATSDHGEFAGDYGLPEKWPNAMTDNLIHVPFLVMTPGAKEKHRVQGPIESFDLMATILELAGIKTKHTHFAHSLLPHLKGEVDDLERNVYCEGGYDAHEPHCFEGYEKRGGKINDPKSIYYPKALQQQEVPNSVCRSVMVRNLKFKLIRRSEDINELYDLEKDPMEIKNEYYNREYQKVVSKMESDLIDWYLKTSDTVPFNDDPRGF